MSDSEKGGTPNPWAVCNTMAKKHGWDQAKTEACILSMKKEYGIPMEHGEADFLAVTKFEDAMALQEIVEFVRENPVVMDIPGSFFDLADEVIDFMSAPFSVYGGKRYLATKLAPHVPKTKRYVEPFMGSAAIMFAKDPAPEEILTDVDPQKIFGMNFLKNVTDIQRQQLLKKNWNNSKEWFLKVRDWKPDNDVDRFFRYMFLQWVSFGAMGKSWARSAYEPGRAARYIEQRMPRFKERLKNVNIHLMDWKQSIQKFDSPDTFFYLDPPHIGTDNKNADHFKEPSAQELFQVISRIRGKWMMSNADVPDLRKLFAKFNVMSIGIPTQVNQISSAPRVRGELVISNFPMRLSGIASTPQPQPQPAPKPQVIAAQESQDHNPFGVASFP